MSLIDFVHKKRVTFKVYVLSLYSRALSFRVTWRFHLHRSRTEGPETGT